ncbi:hypothetical protein EXIGLDRAFT_837567 [Exidia glandulosa HHB12029]|uniref:Uncharacterized protein n=1 Tax=Exidia glandulosa HHB12029 TaxID=1314781 RepID=A0A166ADB9_EXIGL|nr:hypothetical protein EXIGLDRAFT_837567 [Exidia glandulosa HHB12029]
MELQLNAADFDAFSPVAPRHAPADAHPVIADPPSTEAHAVPKGCELLVRKVSPAGSATAKDIAQQAVDALYKEAIATQGKGALFPLTANFAGKSENGQDLYHSTVLRLHPAAASLFPRPTPKLLEAWIPVLQRAHPDWEVLPAPLSFGRDKRSWLSVHDAQNADTLLKEIRTVLAEKGHTLVSSYKTRVSDVIYFVFTSPDVVENVLKAPLHVKSSKQPVRFQRSFQIDPVHIFEIAVSGYSQYDHTIVSHLRSVFEHAYRADGHPKDVPVIVDARVSGDYFLVTLRDWDTTARALDSHDVWQRLVAERYPLLGRPRLLVDVNDSPRERTWDPKMTSFAAGSQAYADDRFNEVYRRMDAMQADNARQYQELSRQTATIASSLAQVTNATEKLKLAFTAVDAVASARDQVQSINADITQMRLDIALAPDDRKPAMQRELQERVNELKKAREDLELARNAQRSIQPTLVLPSPPSAPSTPNKRGPPPLTPSPTTRRPNGRGTSSALPPPPPPGFAVTQGEDVPMANSPLV